MRSVLTLILCAAPVAAQVGDQDALQDELREPTRAELEQYGRILAERDRARIHPAPDPLELVGVAEGGNDYLSRTPALENSSRRAAGVDPEENYRRRLALYESQARFTSPLPRSNAVEARGGRVRDGRRGATQIPDPPLSTGSKLFASLVGVGILAYAVWTLYRPKGGAEA